MRSRPPFVHISDLFGAFKDCLSGGSGVLYDDIPGQALNRSLRSRTHEFQHLCFTSVAKA